MLHRAICFVIMPFGRKEDAAGRMIDFDAIYREIIAPAIDRAGLYVVRADQEAQAGIIHKLMYERLILSDFALADLTLLNANVYYELGVRHAARPSTTVLIRAQGSRAPFDLNAVRAMSYGLDASGAPSNPEADAAAIVKQFEHCKKTDERDSPLFQLLPNYRPPVMDDHHTDVFHERARSTEPMRRSLAAARATKGEAGKEALRTLARDLGDIDATEASIATELMLAFRYLDSWPDVIALVERMNPVLRNTTLVQENYAMALNREGVRLQRDDLVEQAQDILEELIDKRGPSSETFGLLGRVHKDRWDMARRSGAPNAGARLQRAIACYVDGFNADLRDPYPGVNAVTLMMAMDPPHPRLGELLPVVRYAAMRRLGPKSGYWDHATILELETIARNQASALEALERALECRPGPGMLATTARNLGLHQERFATAGEETGWLLGLIARLQPRAAA